MIETRIVGGKKELKIFIALPALLHKNHELWVPPLYSDEWKYFNPKQNPSHAYCETILAICYKDGSPVGRIMGIINHRYNKLKGENNGRFSCFESINDDAVANSLLTFAGTWASGKGMRKMIGPYGMNYMDPEGFIIEGSEFPPTISTNYNFEYYPELILKSGFENETDYVVYKIDLPNKIPESYYKIRQRVLKTGVFKVVEYANHRELRRNTRAILTLMNDCFLEIFGYSYLDAVEMDRIGKQYLSLLDPRFIKVIEYNSSLVAFIIAMPHISEGLRNSGGKLLPFGFLKIIAALKKSKQLDLLMGGVKQEFRKIGLDVILAMSIIESATAAGFTLLDSHHELASNYKVRAEMERIGGTVYKKYVVFQKSLDE